MIMAGLTKVSTVDFPGMLSAVIFVPGCNFDCFFCHNRHLLNLDYTPIQSGDVLDFLNRRRHLLDGVVISGGEPTIQVELTEMIAGIRRLGFRIKLDTNGTRPGLLANLIGSGLVDYVAIDLKAPWSRYQEICRCAPDEVAAVQKSFELLAGNSIEWEARTTVIPQLSETDLQIGRAHV